jgi:tetratricopeptide (TPR) repeat protein
MKQLTKTEKYPKEGKQDKGNAVRSKFATNLFACATLIFTHVAYSQQSSEISNGTSVQTLASVSPKLHALQQRWAKVNYTIEGDEQLGAFKSLVAQAHVLIQEQSDNAGYWAWLGICQSTYAAAIGGTKALGLAKDAKASFEKSLKLDSNALDGVATFSLGTLYHKVPGWPLSFGNDEKAKTLLLDAVKKHPDSIDANFFYGEFLFNDGDNQEAKEYLLRAKGAPSRPERPIAEKYRRMAIDEILLKIEND